MQWAPEDNTTHLRTDTSASEVSAAGPSLHGHFAFRRNLILFCNEMLPANAGGIKEKRQLKQLKPRRIASSPNF